MRALLHALLTPLAYIVVQFNELRRECLMRLGASGQVDALRRTLNDTFGLEWEIMIEDTPYEGDTLYFAHEGQEAFHLPQYLRYEGEGRQEADFIVRIPDFLQGQEADLRRLIEFYRPAGRSYIIQYYDYNG